MRCSSCEPLLDRYVEGTLTPREMMRVRAHVSACPRCASLLNELRVIDALLATSTPVDLAPNFTFAVMAEARAFAPSARSKRRSVWPVLGTYVVMAWIALAGSFVVFGSRLRFVDAFAASVSAQLGTAFSIFSRSIGHSTPALVGTVIVVLAIDAGLASAAFYIYRRARTRALRSEAS